MGPTAPGFASPPGPEPERDSDLEEDVRTQYYQGGGQGQPRLPSFKDLAAAEEQQRRASGAAAPAAAAPRQPNPQALAFAKTLTPADAAAAMEQSQGPARAHALGQQTSQADEDIPVECDNTPPPEQHIPPRPIGILPASPPVVIAPLGPSPQELALMQQVQRQASLEHQQLQRRAPTQVLQRSTAVRRQGIPWLKLALMAVVGALAGLILALGIAVLFKLAQH